MKLFDLPVEILDQICSYLETTFEHYYWGDPSSALGSTKTFQRLSLVSRYAREFALPLRYRKLVFEHGEWLQRFGLYIIKNPSRAPLVKEIRLGWHYWQFTRTISFASRPNWRLFMNLRTIHITDYLLRSDLHDLSPDGEDFPSLESCYLNLRGRDNHWSAVRANRSISDFVPLWAAPKLQRFEFEGGQLTPEDRSSAGGVDARSPIAFLGFYDVLILAKGSMEELFAIRKTRYLSLRNAYMGDEQFGTLSKLLSSELRGIDISAPERWHIPEIHEIWPGIHSLENLRSMRLEMFQLFPLKPSHTFIFDSYTLHPLPESLERLQVDVRTYWLRREEVYRGLQVLIDTFSGRLVDFEIRLIHEGDLRCKGSRVVEDPLDDSTVGQRNWKFTVEQMHTLQQACSQAGVELTAESIWYKDIDIPLTYR